MRTLIILSIILGLSASTKSQSYHSFIESNKVWSELEYDWDNIFTNKYKFEGDTIINNTTYFIAHLCYSDSLMQNWIFYAFFREESSGKVYGYDDYYDEEYLVYDFSLMPGDSIYTGFVIGGSPLYAFVEEVDSIIIDGEYHKRMIFDEWFDEFWIEGIGSSTGPFKPFWNINTADLGWELLCVEEVTTIIYQNPEWDVCFVNVIDNYFDNSDQNTSYSSIKIFPQPAIESSTIKISDKSEDFNEIELRNALNQIVLQDVFANDQYLLNTKSIPSGLYIILIKGQSKILKSKILINKN